MLIAATLLFDYGCAKQDWINRTLVTVDVTGVWRGTLKMSGVSTFKPDVVGTLLRREELYSFHLTT